MKIARLHTAKSYRIFRDFSWPSELHDFARFNVIYGWNGSGKTSLSNIFRHMERRQALTEGQVEIVLDKTRVAGPHFGTAALPAVRVFNRDTVDRNVFELANQHLPPVFFLGEDSAEKQRQIEVLKLQLAAKLKEESSWALEKSKATAQFESLCTEAARGVKNLLTVAGGGPYNNYNAANFKADALRLSSAGPIPALTPERRSQYLATKEGKVMAKVAEPSVSFPDFKSLTARTQAMLDRSVVSTVIAELVQDPALAGWVHAGLALHAENGVSKCRFCDQDLPESRIQRLEAHFNDEFKRFQLDIGTLVADITAAQGFRKTLVVPPKEALYESLRTDYEKALGTLNQHATLVQQSFDVLLRALRAKQDEPFKNFELSRFITSDSPPNGPVSGVASFFQLILTGVAAIGISVSNTAFGQLKDVIGRHNNHTDSFDAAVTAARAALAQDEVLAALPEWGIASAAVEEARWQEATIREEVAELRKKIDGLDMQVRQHLQPAEQLNEEVTAYLGRDELRFQVNQNGYQITRGGQPAMHLSDGERTAIAFLYFLKSLQGTDFDLKTGVVVIDDPVSSLDANSLFSAFAFMKQRTADAAQLFILTHNFAFFRQVRNWYYHLPGQQKKDPDLHPARFYMLVTDFNDGRRAASLKALDPFLHQYESEYHYLFKRVHEEAHKQPTDGLEAYYAIPNIARRLLESFLAFRVPDKPGELFQKLEDVKYDVAKKTRILRFVHTYSHFDQVAEPGHDPSLLSETPAILREILAFIQECDPQHFKRMTQLVAPASLGEQAVPGRVTPSSEPATGPILIQDEIAISLETQG